MAGITLLEMMISVFISLLLSAALTSLYLQINKANHVRRELSLEYARANKVMDILRSEIHMAGNMGCRKLAENFIDAEELSLTVRYQAFPGVTLLENMHDEMRLIADNFIKFHAGDVLLISDCVHAEVFQVDQVRHKNDNQVIIARRPLKYFYQKNAEIAAYIERKYRTADDVLLRITGRGRGVEIAEGIRKLTFSREARGIHFQFATVSKGSEQWWYGYAATQK